MESEGSLVCSQEPATGLYTESDQSSPHPSIQYFNIPFNIILPCKPDHPHRFIRVFPTGILEAFLVFPMFATFPIHPPEE
jgi:hypothetical protein